MVPFYKIRADLHETWLWQDAEPLYWKWWCDLQYMASYTTRRIRVGSNIREIHPGQLVASISYLVNRWGKSKNMIIRFLHLLEEDGLICKETSHNVSIITILFHAGFGDNPRDNHEDNLVRPHNSDKYRKCGEQINNPRDNHEDNNGDNPRDNHEDNHEDTKIKRKKDKNKEKHSSSADIRAREGKESLSGSDDMKVYADVDAEIEELRNSPIWKEQVFIRFKSLALNEQVLNEYLQRWGQEVKISGKSHLNLSDAKHHFVNWMIIQEDKFNKNGRTNGTDNDNGYRSRQDMLEGTARIMSELRAEGLQHQEELPIL